MYTFNSDRPDVSQMEWENQLSHCRNFGVGGTEGQDKAIFSSYNNPYPNNEDDFPCYVDIIQRNCTREFLEVKFHSPIGKLEMTLREHGGLEKSELKINNKQKELMLSLHDLPALLVVYYPLLRAVKIMQQDVIPHKNMLQSLADFLKALVP